MLETRNAGMANFTDLYKQANSDQKLQDWYEYQMSVRLDENSRIRSAEEKHDKEVSMNFYKMGLSVEQIAKGLNYPVATIKKWLGLVPTS